MNASDWPKIRTQLIARWPTLSFILADPDRPELDAVWWNDLRDFDFAVVQKAIRDAADWWNPKTDKLDGLLPLIGRFARGQSIQHNEPAPVGAPMTDEERDAALEMVRQTLARKEKTPRRQP